MKKCTFFTKKNNKRSWTKPLFLTSLLFAAVSGAPQIANAQTPQERTYANSSATGGEIGGLVPALEGVNYSFTDETDASDADPYTYSECTLLLGALGLLNAYQTLSYPAPVSGTTTTVVKIGAEGGLVGAATTIEVQAYNGSTAVGTPVTVGSLVDVLSGGNDIEVRVTPGATYDGVRITLGTTVLTALPTLRIYGAYYLQNATGSVSCNQPIDNLNGVNTLGVASFTGDVTSPLAAYDDDENTMATFSGVANLAGYTHETVILPALAAAGDSVSVMISTPTALVAAEVLGALSVITFNGETQVDNYSSGNGILNIELLSGGTNAARVGFTASAAFDRVEVRLGGVANVLTSLNVHEIDVLIPAPTVTANDIYVYAGQSTTLTATSSTGDIVQWYDDATPPAPVSATVTTTAADGGNTLNFTAVATRNGCTNTSGSTAVGVHVLEAVPGTLTTAEVSIPYNGSVAVTLNTPTPPGYNTPDYEYSLSSGTLPAPLTLNSATGDITGTPTATASIPLTVHVEDIANNNITVGDFNYLLVIDEPLPLTFGDFKGTVAGNEVHLNWDVHNEKNNRYFAIERSRDGIDFKPVGRVNSQGDGATHDYRYTDMNVAGGAWYYRLRQVDLDGKSTLSQVLQLHVDEPIKIDLQIVPNPSRNHIGVRLSEIGEGHTLRITDLAGRIIYEQEITAAQTNIPANSGIYFVQVITGNGQIIATSKAVVR